MNDESPHSGVRQTAMQGIEFREIWKAVNVYGRA